MKGFEWVKENVDKIFPKSLFIEIYGNDEQNSDFFKSARRGKRCNLLSEVLVLMPDDQKGNCDELTKQVTEVLRLISWPRGIFEGVG